ncbi:MAG TPA: hypothetical protein VMQ17_19500 [Candidatus Sulfotelmatobacter sp.]|nr:hypothetical protein [Candidatus Sulfotelmatobacter sp.]
MQGKTELLARLRGMRVNTSPVASIRPRTLRFALLVAAFLACLFGPRSAASAQISPGPLARPHQFLSGSTNCAQCHKFGGEAKLKCVECHTEIGARISSHQGLHATYNIPPGSSQECARCHSDHNGLDFPLIKWDIKTFNHKETGYVLEGKHAGLDCNKCHLPSRISPQERASIKIKDLNRTYLGLSTSCVPCHEDYHKGRLGPNCLQCHNYEDWKSLKIGNEFDHSKTRYPLTGLHAQVQCAKCHTNGPDGKPRYAGIPFNLCSDCHQDPHHGSFTQACSSCHSTGGWKRISQQTMNQNFDHSKTKYPLEGKHATVGCEQCHANGDFKKPLVFNKCSDCHKPDPHNGQFAKRHGGGECFPCHTVQGWKPSTYTVKDHATSAYPLEGGHARVDCDKCHIPKGKDTLFKIKFDKCTACHKDEHSGQFVTAPYFNACDQCHTLDGYKPSTFSLAKHKKTQFALTGGHIAVPCADCHKESDELKPKSAIYHWKNLDCTSCHEDVHKGQFKERMEQKRADGSPAGCEACHSTKSWKEMSAFDHSKTKFPLLGAHKATACIDCHKPPNLDTKLIHADFKAAPTECEDCHEDIHGKQFAKADVTRCADCHNSIKWKPSTFDHDKRTDFPLRGAHQNVGCAECHKLTKVVAEKTVLFYKPTPKDCAACHGPTIPVPKSKPSGS